GGENGRGEVVEEVAGRAGPDFAALHPGYGRGSIIPILPPRAAPVVVITAAVIRALDAVAADAAYGAHALAVAAELAALGAAGGTAGVDRAPRIVVGGLGVAGRGGGEQGGDDEGRCEQAHGLLPGKARSRRHHHRGRPIVQQRREPLTGPR